MKIEFADRRLALLETERASDTNFPVAVIQLARHRLSVIRAAPDIRTLQNWKSLGLRARSEAACEHLVNLSAGWILVLKIEEDSGAMNVTVIAIDQPVRGAA
ncbi:MULTISPECIES: hypothetical protein [unclassified Bradyrhizobium]|uniref:hypothetical protein n=1 Tax=unclassified Bradyrhizobium TaxID=2631580 RepID=UPI0029164424|nr:MULTISPECIES: hypothetical protein [unclassified Bradyrhizobium]